MTSIKFCSDNDLVSRYLAHKERILDQINSVHGYLTAADIELRDELTAEIKRRNRLAEC